VAEPLSTGDVDAGPVLVVVGAPVEAGALVGVDVSIGVLGCVEAEALVGAVPLPAPATARPDLVHAASRVTAPSATAIEPTRTMRRRAPPAITDRSAGRWSTAGSPL
jgi:hypothetical protein